MLAESAPPSHDPHQERAERQAKALQRLAQIAMNFAEDLEARRQEPDADIGARSSQFNHAAKTVRQVLALEERFAQDGQVLAERRLARAERQAAERLRQRKVEGFVRKAQTGMMLENLFSQEVPDFEPERFAESIAEWLYDASEHENFADLTVEQIAPKILKLLEETGGWEDGGDEEGEEDEEGASQAIEAELSDPPPPEAPAPVDLPPVVLAPDPPPDAPPPAPTVRGPYYSTYFP